VAQQSSGYMLLLHCCLLLAASSTTSGTCLRLVKAKEIAILQRVALLQLVVFKGAWRRDNLDALACTIVKDQAMGHRNAEDECRQQLRRRYIVWQPVAHATYDEALIHWSAPAAYSWKDVISQTPSRGAATHSVFSAKVQLVRTRAGGMI
jgi:hypothetical protein